VWARECAKNTLVYREQPFILDGELERLEYIGIHSSYDLLTSESNFTCCPTCM
jgi:hypothetical protein